MLDKHKQLDGTTPPSKGTAMKTTRFLVPILLLALPSLLFAQRPLSGEIRVNVRSQGAPSSAKVAMNSQGDFVVIWNSYDPEDGAYSLYGRRYEAGGSPVTGEIEIRGKAGYSVLAAVAMLEEGSFVVVYAAYADAQVNHATFTFEGQRFAADGTPLGAFAIGTGHAAADLSVRARPDGGFVVVWEAYRQEIPQISFRLFSADAEPLGPETSITTGNDPAAAVGPNGEMVVGWMTGEGGGEDPDFFAVGQRLAPDGGRRGGRFVVSDKDRRFVQDIQIAKDGSGSFLVVWNEDFGRLGPGVFARRYDRNGRPLSGIMRLANRLLAPDITMERNGSFVLVWASGPFEDSEVLGQRFTADGRASRMFQVNESPRGSQVTPKVAGDGAGGFVVVWVRQGQNDRGGNVFARLYQTR
jgi:hypothetical protein